jgi:serine protease Do
MLAAALLIGGLSLNIRAAENRDTKVRNDKSKVEATGKWIYNDLEKALNEGRRAGKPILVTLRCIP